MAILRKRAHFGLDVMARRRTPRILLCGAIMAGALYATEQRLLPVGKTNIPEFLLLTLVGGIFYFGPGLLLRAFDVEQFLSLLKRRRAKAPDLSVSRPGG